MPNSKSEDLFLLIKALSSSDKRAFRLFVGTTSDENRKFFIQLFDLMDQQKELNDHVIIKKMGNITASKYTNLKRHLYSKLLVSLRQLEREKRANIKIREQIDYIYILYGKGLYMQALKILEKAKKEAIKHHTDFSYITLVEIEKMIHSNHITRSENSTDMDLVKQASDTINTLFNRISLSNLRIILHKFYIEKGHAKNENETQEIKRLFEDQMLRTITDDIGMMEQVYLNQSYVWYYYILNDFDNCFKYALHWVKLFEQSKELQERDINLYLRGYHYLLTSAFNLKRTAEYEQALNELEIIRNENYSKFTQNSKIVSFLYVHTGRMNLHFLKGSFKEGVIVIQKTLKRINQYSKQLDQHKIMVLYYKISWMYIGNNEARLALKYLKYIIDMNSVTLREDIQSYARLLHLVVIYDLKEYDELIDLNRSYSKYFKTASEINLFQDTVISMFKKLTKTPVLEHKSVLGDTLNQLDILQTNQYEKKAFIYLDIKTWLKAKLLKTSIAEIIKKNLLS